MLMFEFVYSKYEKKIIYTPKNNPLIPSVILEALIKSNKHKIVKKIEIPPRLKFLSKVSM